MQIGFNLPTSGPLIEPDSLVRIVTEGEKLCGTRNIGGLISAIHSVDCRSHGLKMCSRDGTKPIAFIVEIAWISGVSGVKLVFIELVMHHRDTNQCRIKDDGRIIGDSNARTRENRLDIAICVCLNFDFSWEP